MAEASSIKFFEPLLNSITSMIGGAAGTAANPGLFRYTFILFFTASFMMWAVRIYQGKSKGDVQDVSLNLIKYILVATSSLAFAFPSQSINVAWLVANFPEMLGSALGAGTGAPAKIDAFFGSAFGIFKSVMQNVFGLGLNQIGVIIVSIVAALILLMAAALVCVVAVGTYLAAKVGVFIGIVFAPIALLTLLVPATQQYFSKWVGFMVANAVLLVIISLMLNMLLGGANQLSSNIFTFEEIKVPTAACGVIDAVCDFQDPGSYETVQKAKDINFEGLVAAILLFALTGLLLGRAEGYAQALSDNAGTTAQGFATAVAGPIATVAYKGAQLGLRGAAAGAGAAGNAGKSLLSPPASPSPTSTPGGGIKPSQGASNNSDSSSGTMRPMRPTTSRNPVN
jgi:TrbL/VirB6 plasmid conjugal transfer protein